MRVGEADRDAGLDREVRARDGSLLRSQVSDRRSWAGIALLAADRAFFIEIAPYPPRAGPFLT